MDRQRVREREAQCTQEWPPACAAACPVHVDARGLIERVRGGDLAGGLALFAATVPFPRIIGRICDRPCERACKRRDAGDAVRINALERACVERGGIAPRRIARSGARTQRVAVVGAGLSGLTAAVDLAGKGYRVVVFEADARAGGRLRQVPAEVLPDAAIEADLEVLPGLGIELRCGVRVGNGPDVLVPFDGLTLEFDAVYLGPGPGSVRALRLGLAEVDGERLRIDPLTFATSAANVFAGGGQRYAGAFSPITSLQDGRYAAVSVDRFLQQASLTAARDRQGPFATRLFTSTRGVAPRPVTPAADAALGYTTAEAVQEAERCLSCQCLECVKACEYLKHYGSYPKRYVRQIYNNDCIVMGARPLNRMVNSCALCGLCATVCPEKLSMGEVSREARRSMVVKGKMPASVHEFALRDMAFSAGEHFSLSRHEPGHSSSAALFFPGCQLSASSPDHVVRLYEHLRGTIPGGVGLHLGCCGAPADWAAREDLLAAALEELAATWERMGNPRVITACASCHRLLRERLPAARVESVWPLLAELGIPGGAAPPPARLAVHDPCATRDVPEVQQSVRRILARLGVEVVELEHGRETTTCCGYGGLMTFADPALADQVVARRIAEADTDYLAYCAMCRDRFASKGKRTLHLLDLLLGSSQADPGTRERPTYSERHENRARLKARLLRDVWRERPADAGRRPMELDVSPEVRALLERRMILVEDVASVIANAEASGEKLQDVASGHLLAAYRPVTVTYRVEYSVLPDRVVVHNAYSHRMEVTPGATT